MECTKKYVLGSPYCVTTITVKSEYPDKDKEKDIPDGHFTRHVYEITVDGTGKQVSIPYECVKWIKEPDLDRLEVKATSNITGETQGTGDEFMSGKIPVDQLEISIPFSKGNTWSMIAILRLSDSGIEVKEQRIDENGKTIEYPIEIPK